MNADIRGCVENAVEALALNHAQQVAIFDPSPESRSLARRIVALESCGVPHSEIKELLDGLRDLMRLNAMEAREEKRIAGVLELVLKAPNGPHTVKQLATVLRPHLIDFEDGTPEQARKAILRLRRLIDDVPRERLLAPSLRHELRGRHDVLLRLMGATPA